MMCNMDALQDREKYSGARCNVEGIDVEGSNKEGSNKEMIFVSVFHAEEELEESGLCLECVALYLLMHPVTFYCLVGMGVSLCLKRIGGHYHCPWDACCSF